MSYQALARKWRPRDFSALVGQDHVVRALTNALESRRLHHAYLFTGTRGVGKTTIARILAKALNCVGADGTGDITATPCNVCLACTAIDTGRFVDYVEMDAASNRGVEEMTQLLERAAYAPTNARYKVYTIDEVHMLTSHAFNAMLKTLEEPPDYVKFILATTDPQKIPVTVLSRCLQFNLKQVAPAAIVERLTRVLDSEGLPADPAPLRTLALAARGSMRDALSLLDQAIVFSAGHPTVESVQQMLGSIDATVLVQLLDAVADGQAVRVLALADEMAERGFAFSQALRDLASLLHRIALLQGVPESIDESPDAAEVRRLGARISPEQVQLYYQIALHGRNDLSLAPDEYAGFTMTLLRMLAFAPETAASAAGSASGRTAALVAARRPRTATAPREPASAPAAGPALAPASAPAPRPALPPAPDAAAAPVIAKTTTPRAAPPQAVPAVPALPPVPAPPASAAASPGATEPAAPAGGLDWPALAVALKLSGLARELALRSELVAHEGDHLTLRVPIKTLLEAGTEARLCAALTEHFGRPVVLSMQVGAISGATAASRSEQARAVRQQQAEDAIYADPFVRELIDNFGASVDPRSIRPAPPEA
jgi:DNA polymerase-3 subunit gamma/tau